MPTTINISPNTFAGSLSPQILTKMTLKSRSFDNPTPLVTLVPNIIGKEVLRKFDVGGIVIGNNVDTFSASGTIDQSEVLLEPIRMRVMLEYSRDQVYKSWYALNTSAGVNKHPLPREIESHLIDITGKEISAKMELLIWAGKTASSSFTFTGDLDGFFALAKADAPAAQNLVVSGAGQLALTGITNAGLVTVGSTANLRSGNLVTIGSTTNQNQTYGGATIKGQSFTIKVLTATTIQLFVNGVAPVFVGTAATSGGINFINASNIQNEMLSVVNVMPIAVKSNHAIDRDLNIYISMNMMQDYKLASAQSRSLDPTKADYRDSAYNDPFTDRFMDYKVEAVPSLIGNQILFASAGNIFAGMSALSDMDQLLISDQMVSGGTLDNVIRVSASFSMDAKIGYATEVVTLDTIV